MINYHSLINVFITSFHLGTSNMTALWNSEHMFHLQIYKIPQEGCYLSTDTVYYMPCIMKKVFLRHFNCARRSKKTKEKQPQKHGSKSVVRILLISIEKLICIKYKPITLNTV